MRLRFFALLFDNCIGRKRNVDGGSPCVDLGKPGSFMRNKPTVTYLKFIANFRAAKLGCSDVLGTRRKDMNLGSYLFYDSD